MVETKAEYTNKYDNKYDRDQPKERKRKLEKYKQYKKIGKYQRKNKYSEINDLKNGPILIPKAYELYPSNEYENQNKINQYAYPEKSKSEYGDKAAYQDESLNQNTDYKISTPNNAYPENAPILYPKPYELYDNRYANNDIEQGSYHSTTAQYSFDVDDLKKIKYR